MLGRIGILCFSAGFLFGFSFIALATQIGDKFVAQGKRIWLECMKMELKIVFWTNKRPNGMEKISHKNVPYHEIRPPSDEIWKMYKHYALMRMQLWTEELAWMHIRFWSEAECRWCMATIEMLWRKYDVTHKLRIFWEMRGCWMPENVCVCVFVYVFRKRSITVKRIEEKKTGEKNHFQHTSTSTRTPNCLAPFLSLANSLHVKSEERIVWNFDTNLFPFIAI